MSNQSLTHEFYKEITCDSRHFRSGTRDKPLFYFESFMDDMDFVHVSTAVVPTTYYVFSSPTYNTLVINNNTATIPEGNYTVTEWIAAIQTTGAASSVGLTINYNAITNKLTFTGTSPLTFSSTGMHEMIGLNPGNNTNGTTTFVSPNCVNFSGPNYVVLHARMASTFNGSSIYFTKELSSADAEDKWIMIPIDQNRNSSVIYNTLPNRYFEWFDTTTRHIELYFTLGHRTETLRFNGEPFQVSLAGYTRNTMSILPVNQNMKERYS